MRKLYAEGHTALAEAFRHHLAGAASLSPIEAGLQTLCNFGPEVAEDALVACLVDAGFEVHGVAGYCIRTALPPSLVLGFAAFTPEQIRQAVGHMAGA
jgi:GntR family transcriptional regulator/MocR family aminotransferase